MPIAFNLAPFKTTGGTVSRSLSAWFSDVINVKDMGATGDGTTDDHDAIQAAIDLAFGSPPNGWDNRHLNRPLFFPPGRYNITTPLELTKIVGGHIYGGGKHSTRIQFSGYTEAGPLLPCINMNGCSDLCIEKLAVINNGASGAVADTNTCALNIDWDGDDTGNGCDGNHDIHFQEVQISGGQFTVVLGSDATSEGHGMLFLNCTLAVNQPGAECGYDIRGPNASAWAIGGGAVYYYDGGAGARCPAGGGSFYCQGLAQGGNYHDYVMESGKMMYIGQQRSESPRLLRMENGLVTINGASCTDGMVDAIEINGGICNVEGCDLHNSAQIIGTGGELNLWGSNFGTSVTPLSGYSGTVVWNPANIPAS